MLHRQTVPAELRADREEAFSPTDGHPIHAVIDGLLVDEDHNELPGVDLPGPDEGIGQMRQTQAVFSGRKAQIDRHAVGEHIQEPLPRCGHDVDRPLDAFYSHIFSPHFGQTTKRRCNAIPAVPSAFSCRPAFTSGSCGNAVDGLSRVEDGPFGVISSAAAAKLASSLAYFSEAFCISPFTPSSMRPYPPMKSSASIGAKVSVSRRSES